MDTRKLNPEIGYGDRSVRGLGFGWTASACPDSAESQTFPLDSLAELDLVNAQAAAVEHRGRKAVKVAMTEAMQKASLSNAAGDRTSLAVLPVEFQNGTIEVEIAAVVNGRGARDARGFAGIAFRVSPKGEAYEAVYLRMTNGRLADPPPGAPRNIRAIQYVSHPKWDFDALRKAAPDVYEKGADIAPGPWFRYRLEIEGTTMRAFLGDAVQPALVVTDMKLGANAKGRIALFVDDGTDAFFSNLKVAHQEIEWVNPIGNAT